MNNFLYIVSDTESIYAYKDKNKAIQHVKDCIGESEGLIWCDEVDLSTLKTEEICSCVDGEFEIYK